MWPFRRKSLKDENSNLVSINTQLERELKETSRALNDFNTKKSLGRLIEVPRKIGDNLYIIMQNSMHPNYDCELIGMRRSDKIPENNIKIISITIIGYVIRPSGVYVSFREQYDESITYYININSPNLFLTMDAALGEMYSNNIKKKYSNDPFIILEKEDILITTSDTCKKDYPINNINFIN